MVYGFCNDVFHMFVGPLCSHIGAQFPALPTKTLQKCLFVFLAPFGSSFPRD